MSQSQKLITTNYGLNNAKNFIMSFDTTADNRYYFFAGYSVPFNTIQTAYDDTHDTLSDAYRNMLYGKKIYSSDVALSIPRYDYQSNTVHAMYDDVDANIFNEEFYAIVTEGTYKHVFKCVDNNGNTASTISPSISQVTANDEIYQTSDGYKWKYMCTSSQSQTNKFMTTDYFPVFENTSVTAAAVPGSIDIVKLVDGGSGYFNYLTGTFSVSDTRLNANSLVYALSNSASTTNNAYTGCYLHITSGTGQGQYQKVLASFANSTKKFVVLDSTFPINPDNTSQYELYPAVEIIGDYTQSINAYAIAIINSYSGNSVSSIKMLSRGRDFKYATAVVNASPIVVSSSNFRQASIRPILPPKDGHGANIFAELGAKYATIGVNLANSEGNTIVANASYSQIGIMKNPLFSNVSMTLTAVSSAFSIGEKVFRINPVKIVGTATINLYSTAVTGSGTDFNNQFNSGDMIYLVSNDSTTYQLSTVNSVGNSTYLTLTTNSIFTDTSASISLPDSDSSGYVIQATTGAIQVTNSYGIFSNSDLIVGSQTGCKATVNTVSRSNQTKSFDTFVQMFSYDGTLNSGTFVNNEIITPSTDTFTANAVYNSLVNYGSYNRLYVTQAIGTFNLGASNTVRGTNSGAIFTPTNKYYPEIVYGSGDILYIENIDAVNRRSDQTETFKLTLEF